MDLEKIWEEKQKYSNLFKRNTLDDFLNFIGPVGKEEVENMNFREIENLGKIYGKLRIEEIKYLQAFEQYKVTWNLENREGKYSQGDRFWGRGNTYEEAALKGLMVYWEIKNLREEQHGKNYRQT